LCFANHDVLVELLHSGEEYGVFTASFEFRDEGERTMLAESADVFEWFERTGRKSDRNDVLRRTLLQAVLSDFLHFIYEALETSRKGKLTTTYALLRKPLQDNLFVLEAIATDLESFSEQFVENPLKLQSRTAGDRKAHSARIANVLDVIGESDRFDPDFLAEVRYDKSSDDSFAGSSNQALHLFTDHPAIRTEPLNINFIFSDWEAKKTQWYYLYSRLPYVLFYARRLVEHVCGAFTQTDPEYLADVERRIAAATLLWAPNIEQGYRHPAIDRLIQGTHTRLEAACVEAGHRPPLVSDLPSMAEDGRYPDEPRSRVLRRAAKYKLAASRQRLENAVERTLASEKKE
jgi:hypothetical protein